jgi:subfamily B ATP-binding cassette protein MsbA
MKDRTVFVIAHRLSTVKNAPIVILDEATSALDNKSEAVVQRAIDNLMKDRTVFVIAHRLSTVKNADKIVVVNHGKIVEVGTHNSLINDKNSAYYALHNSSVAEKLAQNGNNKSCIRRKHHNVT